MILKLDGCLQMLNDSKKDIRDDSDCKDKGDEQEEYSWKYLPDILQQKINKIIQSLQSYWASCASGSLKTLVVLWSTSQNGRMTL